MAKNFLGFEDNSFDGAIVHKGEVPSIEGAVHGLTGVRLPMIDASRGARTLASNLAVLGEGLPRYMGYSAGPAAENALQPQQAADAGRIKSLRDEYLQRKRLEAGQGKSFYPSME